MKEFKRLDFLTNQALVNSIKELAVFEGRINHFLATMAKEVYLIINYTESETVLLEDKTIDLIGTFDLIRKKGLFTQFKKDFHRDDVTEFEKLLELELQEESKIQLENIRREKSLENVVEEFLWNLQAKIPSEEKMMEMIKEMPKALEGLDKGKLDGVLKVLDGIGKK